MKWLEPVTNKRKFLSLANAHRRMANKAKKDDLLYQKTFGHIEAVEKVNET